MPTTARQRPLPLALTLLCSALPALAFEPPPDASSLNKAFPGESYSPYAFPFGVEVPMKTQERAYTSLIWDTPPAARDTDTAAQQAPTPSKQRS
jgi:hypothetical protein